MATIPYITGFTVKPKEITEIGTVIFTDGTNDITPNQIECEAYGYTYNVAQGTCSTFTFNTNLDPNVSNINNTLKGSQNTTETGTNNNLILGESNIIRSSSRNNLVVGNENEVTNGINNTTVLGVNGKANRQSEFVIGGGQNEVDGSTGEVSYSSYSDRQMSIVELAGTTPNNTAINLTVNGDGTNYINIRNNSIVGYEVYLTRFELGGSAGTAGNYSYRNMKGVVQIDDSYNMAFIVGFTRNIGKIGANGTFSMIDTSTSDVKSISLQVSDRNNVSNVWSATVYIHEIVSTAITF
jgi:hypothetical protein